MSTEPADGQLPDTWDQLVIDARAFLVKHNQPEHVARLVWEAAVLGYVRGTQHAFGRSYEEQRADFPKDSAIVVGVMQHVTVDFEHFQVLRQLAYASLHAKQDEEGGSDD